MGLQAKDYAHEAAMGAVCAAMAALKAVESDLAADYASSKDYARLKNHAEANGLALKVDLPSARLSWRMEFIHESTQSVYKGITMQHILANS